MRFVESEQTASENQHFTCTSPGDEPNAGAIFIGPLYALEAISSGNPTKILSPLRIPKQGPLRAYGMPPEPQCFPWHAWLFFSLVNPFQGTLLFPLGLLLASPGSAGLPHWTIPGTHPLHSIFGGLNNYCHPTGAASVLSFLVLKRVQSPI